MTILQVVILAIVEGITEFLPVSSTGHLILTSHLLGLVSTDFVKSFELFIQLGAIVAIVSLYPKRLIPNKAVWGRLLAAFLPTAVIGLVLYHFIKQYLLGNILVTVIALFVGGIILIVFEKVWPVSETAVRNLEGISYPKAVLIGVIQSVSVIPGVSRAAATILGGMAVGYDRATAAEFSFLLAVPTLAAATGLDLVKSSWAFSGEQWGLLLLGCAIAFVVARLTVRSFVGYLQQHTLASFGIYRIVVALLFWFIWK